MPEGLSAPPVKQKHAVENVPEGETAAVHSKRTEQDLKELSHKQTCEGHLKYQL